MPLLGVLKFVGSKRFRPAGRHFAIQIEGTDGTKVDNNNKGFYRTGKQAIRSQANTNAELDATAELAIAAEERQAAERHLNAVIEQLSHHALAGQWSASGARIVSRVGGTPSAAAVTVAGSLALLASIITGVVSATTGTQFKIQSPNELAQALQIPLVGDASSLRSAGPLRLQRTLFPAMRRFVVHASEAVVATALAACLVLVVAHPSLSPHVLADPLGTLGEIAGRLAGG